MGHKENTNMDDHINNTNLYFDTKSLRDTVTPILRNISDSALNELQNLGLISIKPSIQYQFPHTDSEEVYQNQFLNLKKEFLSKFKVGITSIHSEIISELTYVLNWGGISSTISTYSPFERAEKLTEPLLIRYTDKFLKEKPFMLVLVNHPWFNQVDSGAFDSNETLYRALARRIFMQFRFDTRRMSEINSKFQGIETIDNVTKHISAILFIDVLSAVDKGHPYNWFLFTNPRAKHPISSSTLYFEKLYHDKGMCLLMDDFQHDNY